MFCVLRILFTINKQSREKRSFSGQKGPLLDEKSGTSLAEKRRFILEKFGIG